MMLTLKWDKVQKLSTYLLIIGVLCVAVAGPVLTQAFSTWPAVPETSKTVPETSMSNIRDAYTYKHTIIGDNQLSIKIIAREATSRVYVLVYTMANYQPLYDGSSAPSSASQALVISIPVYGSSPWDSYTDTVYDSASDGTFAIIEFGGSSAGSYPATVEFIPGDYMVVVYGDNTGTGTVASFSIQITQELFGRVAGRIVNSVGWGLVIACSIICLALWIRKEVANAVNTMEVRA